MSRRGRGSILVSISVSLLLGGCRPETGEFPATQGSRSAPAAVRGPTVTPRDGAGGPAPELEPVLRRSGARAQLVHARQLRGRLVGTSGVERERARASAVQAYDAVWRYWPGESLVAAEAAFRAGELLRAGGEVVAAIHAFRRARSAAPHTLWSARAAFELGNVHRRSERYEAALASYTDVFSDPFASSRLRDRARYWAARVQEARGRAIEARLLYECVAYGADDPADRVRAFDRLARARHAEGDHAGARQLGERCRASVARVVAEQTERGSRVRAALSRMFVCACQR